MSTKSDTYIVVVRIHDKEYAYGPYQGNVNNVNGGVQLGATGRKATVSAIPLQASCPPKADRENTEAHEPPWLDYATRRFEQAVSEIAAAARGDE